jgi:hypothetical protein
VAIRRAVKVAHRQWLGASLVPFAALVVHQLRYMLAFGSNATSELADQGHSYMHEVTPWIVLVCCLGFGAFLTRCARVWHTGEAGSRRTSFVRLWLVAATGLVAIYAGQEFLEGLFATGHPSGLVGVFGDGGLWAVPAALAVGAVLALVIRGARRVVALIAERVRRRRPRGLAGPADGGVLRPAPVFVRPCAPLARLSAGRAPPVSVVALTLA